jgi:manganese/zinc/iron transport system ATP- binding protein
MPLGAMSRHSEIRSADPERSPAVRLDKVDVAVGGTRILHDITFSIDKGEFVLVLGPNGAGKTTLLKVINGLLPAAEGEIVLFGERLASPTGKRLRKRIAYLPQDISVDTRIPITVRDVVGIGRLAHKPAAARFTRSDTEIVDRAMDLVGIAGLAGRPFGQLSAGQKQKVSLARALSQQAEIMLLDEPLSNLDPRAQEDVCETIDSIHEEASKTVLLVTHLLETVPRSADRAMLLKDGTFAGKVDVGKIYDSRFRHGLYAERAAEGTSGDLLRGGP